MKFVVTFVLLWGVALAQTRGDIDSLMLFRQITTERVDCRPDVAAEPTFPRCGTTTAPIEFVLSEFRYAVNQWYELSPWRYQENGTYYAWYSVNNDLYGVYVVDLGDYVRIVMTR